MDDEAERVHELRNDQKEQDPVEHEDANADGVRAVVECVANVIQCSDEQEPGGDGEEEADSDVDGGLQ